MGRFVQTDMGNRGARYYGMECATMTVKESAEAIITQVSVAPLGFMAVADDILSGRGSDEVNHWTIS